MIYLLQTDTEIIYPYVKEQLRATFPNVSFPFPITDETAAEHGCFPVATIERPDHDPRTQRLEEDPPERLEDGTWQQVLRVRDATPEEVEAWDISNRPAPEWDSFMATLLSSPAMNAAMLAARDVQPIAASALPAAMLALANGQGAAPFSACWSTLAAADLFPADLLAQVVQLAAIHYLPDDVQTMLAGESA